MLVFLLPCLRLPIMYGTTLGKTLAAPCLRWKKLLSNPHLRRFSTIRKILTLDPGSSVPSLTGWVRSCRSQKTEVFLELNDGSGAKSLQVLWPTQNKEVFPPERISSLSTGSSVKVSGKLVKSPKALQNVELVAEKVELLGDCDTTTYPLQKKGHSVEFLRDIVHLRSRGALGSSVMRTRSTLTTGVMEFFAANDYINVHTPIITSNDCEGAGELFSVDSMRSRPTPIVTSKGEQEGSFFKKPVYLTVSGQLHLEAFACSMSRVYTFGPTFRAENSNTPRHLSEFWMLEAETAPGTISSAMDLAESCFKSTLEKLVAERRDDIEFFNARVDSTLVSRLLGVLESTTAFPRISYADAIKALRNSGQSFTIPVSWENGLALEHEKWLAESFVGGPVFVTHYPREQKPFYMRQDDAPPEGSEGPTVAAFDLLVPRIGELVGGSQREERPLVLAKAMSDKNLLSARLEKALSSSGILERDPNDLPDKEIQEVLASLPGPANLSDGSLDWYFDTRRYGTIQHAGWGMGFERLVMFATGVSNVRDAVPVPRVPGSCRM